MPIPDACTPAEEEALLPCDTPYRIMFETLSLSRSMAVGMGGAIPLPIAYSEISRYARDMGLASCPADLEECVQLVRAQDGAYLGHHAAMSAPKGTGAGRG